MRFGRSSLFASSMPDDVAQPAASTTASTTGSVARTRGKRRAVASRRRAACATSSSAIGAVAAPPLGEKLTGRRRIHIFPSVMAKPRRGDAISVSIDDLAFGGEGVGRVNGYVIFVRGGIPGDRLTVRLTEARARYGRGVIEAIETPSPDRVDAPCPYFGRCGGCRLQHVAYPA